jgi:repressor LexA
MIGNREVLSKNLSKFMKLNGKTQMDLAHDLKVSQTTISEWMNGKKYPRIDKLQQLADYFGVYKSELVEDKSYFKESYGIKIPVLGTVPCGVPISAIEEIIDFEEISLEMANRGNFFGLKAKGDSMLPKIENGDTLIVRQQELVDNGNIAIVKVNGDEATCKKIIFEDNGITLIPLNNLFNVIHYNKEQISLLPVTIIGKVVEIRREL